MLANIDGWHAIGMLVLATGLLGTSLVMSYRRSKNVARALAAAAVLNAIIPAVPWVAAGALALAFGRPRLGCSNRLAWLCAAVLTAASAIVVVTWWSLQSGLSFYAAAPPQVLSTPVGIIFFILFGSLANSFFEETLWRHYLPGQRGGSGWFATAVVLAPLFGLTHLDGLPWGTAGVAMTTLFAFAQSGLVRYSGGSLGPAIAVHFVVDCVLLSAMLRGGL